MSDVKVVVRARPFQPGENCESCVQFVDSQSIGVSSQKKPFTFDRVFAPNATQADVFEYAAKNTALDIMKGINGCLIVFGMTSSGKSYTMTGPPNNVGITPRMVETLFQMIESADANIEFQFKVSYVEIYKEVLRDLLDANAKPRIREEPGGRGIFLSDTTVYHAANQQEVYDVLNFGLQRRTTAFTNMNADSSRSHSIFVITVEQTNIETGNRRSGRLFLVDCAGSESVARTGSAGNVLDEAKNINRSLSALGNVISALCDAQPHVPYRDSVLTRLLQDALGGNSRTTLVLCVSMSSQDSAETLSTLRFGSRAKLIKNNATVNEELSPTELNKMLENSEQQRKLLLTRVTHLEGFIEIIISVMKANHRVSTLVHALATREDEIEQQFDVLAAQEAARLTLVNENDMLIEQLARCQLDFEKAMQMINELRCEVETNVNERKALESILASKSSPSSTTTTTTTLSSNRSLSVEQQNVELEVALKQLSLRNDRIRQLEQLIRDNESRRLASFRSRHFAFSNHSSTSTSTSTTSSGGGGSGGGGSGVLRIAKVLRGGGSSSPVRSTPPT